jgi:hypothetical protein
MNYVFITGIDEPSGSNTKAVNYSAKGIFLDGTVESMTIKFKNDSEVTYGPQTNTWYTYSKSSDGIYTVTKVKATDLSSSDKVGQGTVAVANPGVTIDDKHNSVSLAGITNVAYGNNDTVYITAKLAKLSNAASTIAHDPSTQIVIDGVKTISTGIANANITTYTTADQQTAVDLATTDTTYKTLANVEYVLYRSNGYIIGAVIVGVDKAVASNLVYVNSSDLESEQLAGTDQWVWTRKVIQNGEEVTLKETGAGTELTYLANKDTTYTKGMKSITGTWWTWTPTAMSSAPRKSPALKARSAARPCTTRRATPLLRTSALLHPALLMTRSSIRSTSVTPATATPSPA